MKADALLGLGQPEVVLGYRKPTSKAPGRNKRSPLKNQDPDYYVDQPTELVELGTMHPYFLERVARILFGASNMRSGNKSVVNQDDALSTLFLEQLSKNIAQILTAQSLPALLTSDDGTVFENKHREVGEDSVAYGGTIMDDPDASSALLEKLAHLILDASNISALARDHSSKEDDDLDSCGDMSRILNDSLLAPYQLKSSFGKLSLDDHGKTASAADGQKGIPCEEGNPSPTKPADISISENMHCESGRGDFHRTSHADVESGAGSQGGGPDKHPVPAVTSTGAAVS